MISTIDIYTFTIKIYENNVKKKREKKDLQS